MFDPNKTYLLRVDSDAAREAAKKLPIWCAISGDTLRREIASKVAIKVSDGWAVSWYTNLDRARRGTDPLHHVLVDLRRL